MSNCPVCSSENTSLLFSINNIPVYCNLLWDSKEEAINCPKGDIELRYCGHCGHVFNSAFDAQKMDYSQSYENSLHFSPRFQKFAEELADSLIQNHQLKGKNLVEIGCGKGDFLKIISEKGGNKSVGFDKSYDPKIEVEDEKVEGVSFIQDWYSPAYKDTPVDFLLCRHVLEHIENPVEFVSTIKSIIENKNVGIYFEVPNILYTLRDLGIWDLIYEHCGYFTPNSIAHLFESSGFSVSNVEEKYLNQFLGIEASNRPIQESSTAEYSLDDLSNLTSTFANSYNEKVGKWQNELQTLHSSGKKVVVWGGGSKGVTFVNILNSKEKIEAIVDINPRKQGKYAAGTGHKFVGPQDLATLKPDVVIVMNPIYKDEVTSILHDLTLTPKVIAENEL